MRGPAGRAELNLCPCRTRPGLLPCAPRACQVPGCGCSCLQGRQGQAQGQPAAQRRPPGRRAAGRAPWRGARVLRGPGWPRCHLAGCFTGHHHPGQRRFLLVRVPDPIPGLRLPGAPARGEPRPGPPALALHIPKPRPAGPEAQGQLRAGGLWGPGPLACEQEGQAAAARGAGIVPHGLADPPAARVSQGCRHAATLLEDGCLTVSGAEMCNTVLGASLGSPRCSSRSRARGERSWNWGCGRRVHAKRETLEGALRLPDYLQSSQTRNSREVLHVR